MTRYTVVWVSSAEDELTEIWLRTKNRNQVTKAVYQIDKALAQDPTNVGEELHEGLRTIVVPPLKAIFSINHDDRLVEVAVVREL